MRRALPLLLAAAVAAACGGGAPEGEPPERWAADVCSSLDEWRGTLEARQRELATTLTSVAELDEAKRRLLAFLDDVTAETEEMLADVERAGTPAVDQGDALARDMRAGLGRLRTAFEQARTRTERLDASNPEQFRRDVNEIGRRLTTQAAAIDETFDELDEEYDVPELDRSFEEEPACRSLDRG